MKFESLMNNKKVLPITGAVLLLMTIILPFIFSGGQSTLDNEIDGQKVSEIQVLPGAHEMGSHMNEAPEIIAHQQSDSHSASTTHDVVDQHAKATHEAIIGTGQELVQQTHESGIAVSHEAPGTVASVDHHDNTRQHEASGQADEQHSEASQFGDEKTIGHVCYELGPVKDDAQKSELETLLQSRSMLVSITFKSVKKDLGYWVYLPPQRSVALGRLKVEEIKLKGIKDVNLLVNHEPKLAISLGIFHEEKNANSRMLKAQSLGFDAKMEMRSMEENQLWLVIDSHRQNDLSEQEWADLLKQNSPIELKTINCP